MSRRFLTRRSFFIATAIALILGGLALQLEIRTNPRPVGGAAEIAALAGRDDLNLLFVLIDTLRADRLSAYGYDRETSPNIDALAATGLRFAEQLWAQPGIAHLKHSTLLGSGHSFETHAHSDSGVAFCPPVFVRQTIR